MSVLLVDILILELRCCSESTHVANSTFCENLLSAELLFISLSSQDKVVLTGFGKIILELLGPSSNSSEVTEEALLHAQPISALTYKPTCNQILSIRP